MTIPAKPRITLPAGYVTPPLKRLPGGADDTGKRMPMCEPATHKDGKHSMLCFAALLGYRELPDGSFEQLPPEPLEVDGARFTYRGDLYIRPVGRGVVLEDDTYLDYLPAGDYEARITLVRKIAA